MGPESADSGAAAGNTETSALVGFLLTSVRILVNHNGNIMEMSKNLRKKTSKLVFIQDSQLRKELVTVLCPTLFFRCDSVKASIIYQLTALGRKVPN